MLGCFVVAVFAVPTFMQAAVTSSAILTITGTVAGSISLTVEDGAGAAGTNATITGSGSNAAATDLGTTFSKYGAAPTGWTKTLQGTTSWTLASNFGVKVEKANTASTDYTLLAHLGTDPLTIVWKTGATPFVAVADKNLTSTGAYGSTVNYTWSVVIPDGLAAPDLANTINFLATAN
jgi:hypothetical protein